MVYPVQTGIYCIYQYVLYTAPKFVLIDVKCVYLPGTEQSEYLALEPYVKALPTMRSPPSRPLSSNIFGEEQDFSGDKDSSQNSHISAFLSLSEVSGFSSEAKPDIVICFIASERTESKQPLMLVSADDEQMSLLLSSFMLTLLCCDSSVHVRSKNSACSFSGTALPFGQFQLYFLTALP